MCLTAVAMGLGGLPALAAVGSAWTTPAWAGTVTVRPGQNLSQIAAELHTSVAALVAANGLADPNRVLAGQLLEIPGTGSGAAPGTAVVVQPGQTLSAIASRYGVSVAALAAANRLGDPNHLLAGVQLVIPGADSGDDGSPTAVVSSVTTTRTVVVGRGQTLTAIAAANGVSVSALVAANKISNPNRVLAGTRLVVPGVAGSAMALASYTVPSRGTGGLPAKLAANPGRLALRPAFQSAAARYGVPVSLLEALCWWESGWQSAIVSSTGAIGVCQIEPYTATFVDRYLAGAALNPQVAEQNIAIGAAFLASLLRATGGDVGQAVAGYYQGLQSVRQRGMLPATANYVHGIEAYAAIFSG
jgi:LysM repeat protein